MDRHSFDKAAINYGMLHFILTLILCNGYAKISNHGLKLPLSPASPICWKIPPHEQPTHFRSLPQLQALAPKQLFCFLSTSPSLLFSSHDNHSSTAIRSSLHHTLKNSPITSNQLIICPFLGYKPLIKDNYFVCFDSS